MKYLVSWNVLGKRYREEFENFKEANVKFVTLRVNGIKPYIAMKTKNGYQKIDNKGAELY